MLFTLIKSLSGPRAQKRSDVLYASAAAPVRLHIGGQTPHPDWKILDVRPGPHVDFVGPCTDLSGFGDGSVSEIYASHVVEHLGYQSELATALREFNRALIPGGALRVSVPDLQTLCTLFLDPSLNVEERFEVMRMMFGGQINDADFHYVGLSEQFLASYLAAAGFTGIARVDNFGIFDDASNIVFKGTPISLNVRAIKPFKN